jgi:hypothetical protein
MSAALAGLTFGLIGLLVGLAIGLIAGSRHVLTHFVAFGLLGLLAGLLVGLSESPVVAATVAAAIGLAGQFVPSLLSGSRSKAESDKSRSVVLVLGRGRLRRGSRPAREPTSASTSTSTPPPSSTPDPPGDEVRWLLPFCLMAIAGVLLGIALRVNNALSFAPRNYRSQLWSEGFTAEQIQKMMDRFADERKYIPAPVAPLTSLLTNPQRASLEQVLSRAAGMSGANATARVDFIRANAPPESRIKEFIDELRQRQTTDEEIFQTLKSRYGK